MGSPHNPQRHTVRILPPVRLEEQRQLEPSADRFRRLDWLSRILDTAWSIPGTPYRIGIDGILGLIPGIGDPLGMMLSSYLIFEAARLGAPKRILLRMVGNVALEGIVGTIPILGDIFDIAWKANVRNLALLRAHRDEVLARERSSRQIMMLIAAALLLLFTGLIVVSFFALRFLYQLLTM
jgi:hypothetical protein